MGPDPKWVAGLFLVGPHKRKVEVGFNGPGSRSKTNQVKVGLLMKKLRTPGLES